MLNEKEWELIEPVLNRAITDVQSFRCAHDSSLQEALQQGYGQPALHLYQELTGYAETNVDAIWHHRISKYGPPCKACGKPLRTKQASFCAACGAQA